MERSAKILTVSDIKLRCLSDLYAHACEPSIRMEVATMVIDCPDVGVQAVVVKDGDVLEYLVTREFI